MRTVASLFAVGFVVSSAPAGAVVIHVNPDGSGDAPTIAAAYAMAHFNDDIVLGPGTYYEHDIVMKSLVDLRSASDEPSDTIVDAQGMGRCLSGIGVTGAPVIQGITFQNGVHDEEGGILLTGTTHNARYQGCVFRDGSAPKGGAVAIHATLGSDPNFTGCVFESNEATGGDGGAIWSVGTGWLYFCTFRQNSSSGSGGAIHSEKYSNWGTQIQNSDFENNSASHDGGAINSTGVGDIYGSGIVSCRFVGNSAAHGGAAQLNEYDLVQSSTFLHNVATLEGGALRLLEIRPDKDGQGQYAGNVFGHNAAGTKGGALAIEGPSTFNLTNCTFAANEAPWGGHFWTSGSPTLRSSILAFAVSGAAAAGTASVASSCTDVFGNVGGNFTGPLVGGASVPTNFSLNPGFCNLPASDFTLHEGSPCLPPLPPTCGGGFSPRIGALGRGCGPIAVEEVSWGEIKARYR